MSNYSLNQDNNECLKSSEELNLTDLINIILKWKWLIVSIFCCFILLTYLFFLKDIPRYEIKAVIQIGKIYIEDISRVKNQAIENPVEFINKITYKYFDNTSKYPKLVSINTHSNDDIIILTVQGNSIFEIENLLNFIISEQLKEFNEAQEIIEGKLNALKMKKTLLESKLKYYNELIPKLDQYSLAYPLLMIDKYNSEEKIVILTNDIKTFEFYSSSQRSYPTKLIRKQLIKGKYRAYFLFAGVVGLFLGLAIVFLIDNYLKYKRK